MQELRALLVDDEECYLETTAKVFRRHGILAITSCDGRNIPELIHTQGCQVVVLDLKIPGVDGLSILREIKRRMPAVQAIMLTGHATADDAVICLTSGAFDFLVKPVEMSHLIERVRAAHELWKISMGYADNS